MKRDAIFAAVICFLAIIMIVSGSFMILPSTAEAAVVGKFTLVEGTVDLLKGGSLPAVPATLNLSVEEKDVVRTKSNARAEIALLDKTVLRVAQRSRIDISEYSGDDSSKKGVIKLDRGKIEAIVEKKPVSRITTGAKANSFEIHTPNAVAGVRGTDFFVSYDRNVSITLVKDGNVCSFNISSSENEVCMPPGFITSIVGTNPPERPKAATREEFNLFEKEFIGITKAGSQPVSVAASNPAAITDMPIVVPITDVIPGTITPNEPPTGFAGEGTGPIFIGNLTNDGTFTSGLNGLDYIWNATGSAPAALQLTGTFEIETTTPTDPHLWYSDNFVSGNLTNLTQVTTDGGAYRGSIGIQEIDGSISGSSYALFLDPAGNIGILRGTYAGTTAGALLNIKGVTDSAASETTGISFSSDGSMVSALFGTSSIAPADFVSGNIITDTDIISGLGAFSGGDSTILADGNLNSMNIAGHEDWGIASALIGGRYDGSISNTWGMSLNAENEAGFFLDADLLGTQWSGNSLKASAAGYWIDSDRTIPATGIYVGETIGTYNPLNSTWQAVVQGAWLETNKFLEMTGTSTGRNALKDLNIPAFEVGRVDLSGAIFADGTSGSDFVSVLMNNVIFFAPSTGQKPGIWATNAITGTYDFTNGSGLNAGTIISPDNVITLEDGNTISADFQFTQWQGGKWVGRVRNGAGDLSGGNGSFTGPINFRGGAAGTHTGTTSGALSGTAAGIVK